MMLIELTLWAQRLWRLLQSGWEWVRNLFRQVAMGIRAALSGEAPASGEAAPATAQATPAIPTRAEPPSQPAAPTASPETPVPATSPDKADNTSDETALARMLASQDRPWHVKVVTAWLTLQKQRTRKHSLFQMLTNGKGYGPQDRKAQGLGMMYASTALPPSPTDRLLARGILSDAILPSADIGRHKPGELIERGQGITDGKLLHRQVDLSQGIYGRIAGTRWYLFSADAPQIVLKPGQNAAAVLDAVPDVPAISSQAPNLAEGTCVPR